MITAPPAPGSDVNALWPGSASSFKDVLEIVARAGVVLGVILYGIVRISTDAFYTSLHTTPEEVGLGYLTIVTRAAIGVVSFGVFALTYGLLVRLFLDVVKQPARRGGLPAPPRDHWVRLTVASAFILLVLVLPNLLLQMLQVGSPLLVVILALFPMTLVMAAWYVRPRDVVLRLVALISVATTLGFLMSAGHFAGTSKAETVQDGGEVSSSALFGVVPVSASCVDPIWLAPGDSPPPELLTGDFMYLGQSNSTLILYRVNAKTGKTEEGRGEQGNGELVRVPSANVSLVDRPCD